MHRHFHIWVSSKTFKKLAGIIQAGRGPEGEGLDSAAGNSSDQARVTMQQGIVLC
jgi:hypothetical protein